MKKSPHAVILLVASAALSAPLTGCGDSAQTQTGTQVQVSDEMKREAEASSQYLEGQSRAKAPRAKTGKASVTPATR